MDEMNSNNIDEQVKQWLAVKPNKIKTDGKHISTMDESFRLYMKAEDKYGIDYEWAIPLSRWR